MNNIASVIIMILGALQSFAGLPEDPAEYAAWEARSLKAIDSLTAAPPATAIAELSLRMLQISRPNTPNYEQGDRPVYHAAQSVLLAIPGHAEYFRDRINAAQETRKAVMGDIPAFSVATSKFYNEQDDGFQTLRWLPSAETVKVLGDYLSDDWDSGFLIQDRWPERPMSRHSVEVLAMLPIVGKPTGRDPTSPDVRRADLSAWRQWYSEIQSGKRTFRFEGDPTEYDLDGPASAETLAAIERDQRRETDRTAGHRKSQVPGDVQSAAKRLHEPTTVIGIIIAGLLLVGAACSFLKQRRGG